LGESKIFSENMAPMIPAQPQGDLSPSQRIASNLRLMLDSADERQWEEWLPLGLFYGVTTNPLLLENAQVPCEIKALTTLAKNVLGYGVQEVQLQAWGGTVDRYVQMGHRLSDIDPRVVVKIPITKVGTAAAMKLIGAGVRVTLTGVYTAPQVLIAAAIGAEYAAPYLGRIHDAGRNGCEDITTMQRSLSGTYSNTRLLVASIRRAEDMSTLAAQGLNTFTFSTAIAHQLFDVAATLNATEAFEAAAQW
jgi:transaldolase